MKNKSENKHMLHLNIFDHSSTHPHSSTSFIQSFIHIIYTILKFLQLRKKVQKSITLRRDVSQNWRKTSEVTANKSDAEEGEAKLEGEGVNEGGGIFGEEPNTSLTGRMA